MDNPNSGVTVAVAMASVIGLGSSSASAQEWRLDRSAWIAPEYSENLRLLPGVTDATFGLAGGIDFRAEKATGAAETELRALASGTLYENNNIPDDGLILLGAGYTAASSERSTLGVTASYVNDSTLDNIADKTDDPGDIDPGITAERVRRNRLELSPSWVYALTERSDVNLRYDFTGVEYGSGRQDADLDNYLYTSLVGQYLYRLTERTTLNAIAQPFLYSSPDADSDYHGGMLTTGLEHRFSRVLFGELSAGAYTTDFDVGDQSARQSGGLFSASLLLRGERTRLRALISRDLLPSGSGEMREADQILLATTHSLTPRLDIGLRARVLKTQDVGVDASEDRDYLLIEPNVSWQLSERFDLRATYRYRSRDEGTGDRAYGNLVSLALTYRWPSGPALR